MEMEKQQELEWLEAQKIGISVDLVAAAKRQLQFLAAVDKNRCLYEGPALQRAIYRYNACWLPLLAKHSESQISEGFLVVPLDCEWIWHCHRLNPVRYKTDCEELYGRILDNFNVVSSIQGSCKKGTEELWNRLYPDEPYDLDLTKAFLGDSSPELSRLEKYTKYDLFSAVSRQRPFFYQVSRSHVNNDIFLEEAVARYKGFLYLIKRNKERSIRHFCVPTYDIDLIWHTHQLHPVSYCMDVSAVLGKVLEHDDMDQDRTKGKKLDTGFSGTTKQWEETYGLTYWKAGAMYRGVAPSALTTVPFSSNTVNMEVIPSKAYKKIINLPEVKVMEVLLEIVAVKNLPEGHKGSLFVLFSKSQPDAFFNVKRKLTILSQSGVKQVASFQCEPTGELLFELASHSTSKLPVVGASKTMGTTSLSLQNFLDPVSKLGVEKWFDLMPSSGTMSSKPVSLRISVSFTLPTLAPHVLHMVRSRPLSKSSCFFPITGRVQHPKSWACVIDETNSEVIRLHMRDTKIEKAKDSCTGRKQVISITESGETHTLAEMVENGWSFMDSLSCLQLKKKSSEEYHHILELRGRRMIKFFQGRKLDYEPKYSEKKRTEEDFLTAVEFSAEDPYGKAIALLELKTGVIKVKEEWFVLPAIISAFILYNTLKKRGFDDFLTNNENLVVNCETECVNGLHEGVQTNMTTSVETEAKLNMDEANNEHTGGCGGGCGSMVNSSGCGGGCGSGCGGGCGGEYGNMKKSSGCGSGCGGDCGGEYGNMKKSSGCGSGCGGDCGGEYGNMKKSSGCGSGCGGGCGGEYGNMKKSSGCGSGCGGDCGGEYGNMKKSSGCGSGCGGDCGGEYGNMKKSSGCGSGCGGDCGGEYGNMKKSSGCGSGCGGGCGGEYGNMKKSSGCGSGCGGDCGGEYGNMKKSSGCGSGCGGDCGGEYGNMKKSSGCGSGCGGGCGGEYGNMKKSSGCGGGCGGGCGNMMKSGDGDEQLNNTPIYTNEAVAA
ncbi:glycine-rich domain-containing protein 1-like [Mangifera indica]|uniref:glycine-rich domain-containing protein 1-like n=1 Tax=Mangifera indica TaxID=29780 RepID=UPI001CFA5123|nr:glycine-rich domain-containing protein 1-like [Mangifera indica]